MANRTDHEKHYGLRLVPIGITDAREFVGRVHRHHSPPVSGLFAVACAVGDEIAGVAIAGRPVARPLDDGWTYEITRVGTDGVRNGCSILYGAVRRAAKALGYLRGITYTLPEEGGASLRASGWTVDGETPGRSWNVPSRPREDKHPLGVKTRWMVTEVGFETRGTRPRVAMPDADAPQVGLFHKASGIAEPFTGNDNGES